MARDDDYDYLFKAGFWDQNGISVAAEPDWISCSPKTTAIRLMLLLREALEVLWKWDPDLKEVAKECS